MTVHLDIDRIMTGTVEVFEAWKRGLSPNPDVSVSEWADEKRILDSRSSKEAGRWSTDRTPYLREIMECVSFVSPVIRLSVMKGAQIGGSEMALNLIGYIMDVAPCPIILVQPTGNLAKRYSKARLKPMIDLCDTLRAKVSDVKAKDDQSTLTIKNFPGGTLVIASSNSAAELRSMAACVMTFEEPDAYPADVDGEGSAVDLVCARGSTYSFRRKEVFNCTPTFENTSIIFSEYRAGDQRHYEMPCPHPGCGKPTVLHREFFRHVRNKPETAHFVCRHCGGKIFEGRNKTSMLDAGRWVPTRRGVHETIRSYYLPSSLSPIGWKS
jgi:phage terminase large subunit GpA-like protein